MRNLIIGTFLLLSTVAHAGGIGDAGGFNGGAASNGNGNGVLTGSQFQLFTFTATNVGSGNSHLVTDAFNDLFITAGGLGVNTASVANSFSLTQRDPNNDLNIAVPTFRSLNTNGVTAMDVIPNGSATDSGWGRAWNDICNTDIFNGGAGVNTSCVHLGSRSTGDVDIGENQYGSATTGKVNIVDGPGNGSGATTVASFSSTISGLTVTAALPMRMVPIAIASLPSCSSTISGAQETVSDSDAACVFNSAPTHASCVVGTNCFTCQVQCAEAGGASYSWIAY